MIDQVTLDIGGGVSAGYSVLSAVALMLTGSRSVTIEVDNNTDLPLIRYPGMGHHWSGGWATKHPADRIAPKTFDVFGSQNRSHALTGTQGYVWYYIGSSLEPDMNLCIIWSNPLWGQSKADVRMSGDNPRWMFKTRYSYGVQDTAAPFTFKLYNAADITGPMTLDITNY